MSVSEILSSLGVPEGTASDGTASDGTVQTRINLHNETQLKDLLDLGLTPEQRSQHADALLDGITVPAGQPGVPLLHRLIRHVIGNDELSDEDRAQLAPALPITAHVVTQKLAAEPAKGPGGGTKQAPMQVDSVWDVSTPDGSLMVIDLPNGIELLPGGCIVARSTPLHFTCTSLLREGTPRAGYGDFNILGATGAPVPTPPTPPPPAQAAAGAPGQCSSAGIAGGRRRPRLTRVAARDGWSRGPGGQQRHRQRHRHHLYHGQPGLPRHPQRAARGGDPVGSRRPRRRRRPGRSRTARW